MIFVGRFIGPIGPPNWWISAPRPGLSSCQVLELINKRFALMDGRAMQQQLELFKAPGSKSMAITRFFGEAIYTYIYGPVLRLSTPPAPPQWVGSPGSTPFPSICKLLAAFLRSSFVFARSLQHFWLPASHLLGTCYLLDDLRSTHTPSKYLRATYSHIYMCSSYLLPVYSHNPTCV